MFFLFFLLSGCAHVISKDLRGKADPSLTFREVFQNPNAYQGKMVIWGGDIVKTINQKDGTTLVEVFQLPLSRRGEPNETYPSEGRFLILTEKYLDPYLFRRGRKITVAGEILGERTMALGKWIIDILSFQANKSTFGRNIITIQLPITIPTPLTIIMTRGGTIPTRGDSVSITIDIFKSAAFEDCFLRIASLKV